MDSDDMNLVLNTEIDKISYNLQWNIDNVKKIPESIRSPKFSFAPGHNMDWYLTVKYNEDDSICVSLSRDSEDDQPLRVECTTCIIDTDNERFSVTLKSIFQNKETRIICNHLCMFPDDPFEAEVTLNMEFSFVLYGLEIETEITYGDEKAISDTHENGKPFDGLMKIENLADVRIQVGKELFTAHKYILRLRAPKLVDKHLRYGNKTTLYGVNPEIFKCLISYIYKNEVSIVELSQHSKELYEFAGKYNIKPLQKICTEELKEKLKIGNVVEYLKMAENHKEESLKRAASKFIKKNLDEMYRRTDWKILIACRPHLESEVLHNF